MTTIYDGHSGSLTFGAGGTNAGITLEIVNISPPERSVEDIDTSHLGTTTDRTYQAGELAEGGEVSVTVHYDPSNEPTLGGSDTITITYPLLSGQTTAAELEFTGYCKTFNRGEIASNTKPEGALTIKVSGDVTLTDAT